MTAQRTWRNNRDCAGNTCIGSTVVRKHADSLEGVVKLQAFAIVTRLKALVRISRGPACHCVLCVSILCKHPLHRLANRNGDRAAAATIGPAHYDRVGWFNCSLEVTWRGLGEHEG